MKKPRKIYYKLVCDNLTSYIVTRPYGVTYKVGINVSPKKIPDSRLFVFDSLERARQFSFYGKVFECECTGIIKNAYGACGSIYSFWKKVNLNLKNKKKWNSGIKPLSSKGACFAKTVKLIKEVKQFWTNSDSVLLLTRQRKPNTSIINQINQNIVDRIRKLLKVAHSTEVQAEAEAFLQKAQELAMENNINIAKLGNAAPQNQEIVKGNINNNTSRLPVTNNYVSSILQKYFNVRVILTGSRETGRILSIIGKEQDVEFATFLYGYLNTTFMNLWKQYKDKYNAQTTARASFFLGLYRGLAAKLTANKQQVEQSSLDASQKEQYGLILVNDEKRLELAVNGFFNKVRSVAPAKVNLNNGHAINSGFEQGGKINIHAGLNGETSKNLAIAQGNCSMWNNLGKGEN